MRNPIIAALDVATAEQAMQLVDTLRGIVPVFKIGSQLFTSVGPEIVRRVRGTGAQVFLDLKFHDIPNTVRKAVLAALELDVQMLTVHCSGGMEMLRVAEVVAQGVTRGGEAPPLVLGVTVLTSMDEPALGQTGVSGNLAAQVERLARLAIDAGLRGLVCSPLELPLLRKLVPPGVQLVTPGIRGPGDQGGDQKRTMSAEQAMAAGANWLVIGRPIYAAPDPRAAAERILGSLGATMNK
jgi:orotidine-5'-phosphate decarboxylase